MSESTVSAGLFSRSRTARPPEPATDLRAAPFGWMWDTKLRKWRPKKTRGKVPQGQARGRVARKKKGPARKVGRQPLVEVEDELLGEQVPADEDDESDPAPSWHEGSDEPLAAVDAGEMFGDSVKEDVRALIALAYTLPAETLPSIDPYCFGPLGEEETGVPIINALTDIVCASPRVAAWAASATGLMPYIRLGFALKPVFVHAVKHHLTRSVEVTVDRDAQKYSVQKRDFSEYTAA